MNKVFDERLQNGKERVTGIERIILKKFAKWAPLESRTLYLDSLVVTGKMSLQEAEWECLDMLDDGRFSQMEL